MIAEEKIVFGLLLSALITGVVALVYQVFYLMNNPYPDLSTNMSIVVYGGYIYPIVFGVLLYILAKAKHISSLKRNIVFMATLLGLGILMAVSASLSNISLVEDVSKELIHLSIAPALRAAYVESAVGAAACITSFVVLIYSKF